jgi:hypothetical protein
MSASPPAATTAGVPPSRTAPIAMSRRIVEMR